MFYYLNILIVHYKNLSENKLHSTNKFRIGTTDFHWRFWLFPMILVKCIQDKQFVFAFKVPCYDTS